MAKKDPTNAQIADAFSELGTLYELDGAVRYRVNAYRDAAKTMRQCPVSIAELTRAGKVTELPGIGKTSEEKIKAFLETGTIPSAEKLKAKFPATLVEVTRIPGLGAKTARRLYDEIGVASVDDLRQAIADQRIRAMKGLGQKAEENIAAQLEKLGAEGPSERVLLSDVLPIAEKLAADLLRASRVRGRRRRRLRAAPRRDVQGRRPDRHRKGPEGAGDPRWSSTRSRRRRATPARAGRRSPRRTASRSTCGSSRPRPTGTCSSTSRARRPTTSSYGSGRVKMGLSVSEHGIKDTESGKVESFATEEEVYERLGLEYIEPELRESAG